MRDLFALRENSMARILQITSRCSGLIVLCCLAIGCVSTPEFTSLKFVDGAPTKVTEGRFGGRWWNYYDRGCSLLQGNTQEFWHQAEIDFRSALSQRPTDGPWARKYGLHFMPEYYPNRELGIALFHQGEIVAAIPYLEKSNAQFQTDRALFYLNAAREKDFKNRQEKGEVFELPRIEDLSLSALADESTLPEGAIIRVGDAGKRIGGTMAEIRGRAYAEAYIAAIEINGESYPLDVSRQELDFAYAVHVKPGKNSFVVSVVDLLGNRTGRDRGHLEAEIDADGPVVCFDEPLVVPGYIRGSAWDASGITSLHIAGQSIELPDKNKKLVRFSQFVQSAKAIAVEARDECDNLTLATLPVPKANTAISSVHPGYSSMLRASSAKSPSIQYAVLRQQYPAHIDGAAGMSEPLEVKLDTLGPSSDEPLDQYRVQIIIKKRPDVLIKEVQINRTSIAFINDQHTQALSRAFRTKGASENLCEVTVHYDTLMNNARVMQQVGLNISHEIVLASASRNGDKPAPYIREVRYSSPSDSFKTHVAFIGFRCATDVSDLDPKEFESLAKIEFEKYERRNQARLFVFTPYYNSGIWQYDIIHKLFSNEENTGLSNERGKLYRNSNLQELSADILLVGEVTREGKMGPGLKLHPVTIDENGGRRLETVYSTKGDSETELVFSLIKNFTKGFRRVEGEIQMDETITMKYVTDEEFHTTIGKKHHLRDNMKVGVIPDKELNSQNLHIPKIAIVRKVDKGRSTVQLDPPPRIKWAIRKEGRVVAIVEK